jgi:hypothetical protein
MTSTAPTTTGGTDGTTTARIISVAPLATANLWPGATVSMSVWAPAGSASLFFQIFSQSNNWMKWDNTAYFAPTPGAWKTITYTIPNTFPGGIQGLGLQTGVYNGGTFAGGDIFIDSITVCGGTASCAGTGTGLFDFEAADTPATDNWAEDGTDADTVVSQATDQFFHGAGSLKVALTGVPAPTTGWTSRRIRVSGAWNVATPNLYCGQTVTFHVYATNVTGLNVQPISWVNSWVFGSGTAVTPAAANTWTTVTYTVPATINSLGLQAIGLQLSNTATTAAYTGTVYIDDVTW